MGGDDHTVSYDGEGERPDDEHRSETGAGSNEGVAEGAEEPEDVDGGGEKDRLDLTVAESGDDRGEELGPGLGGEEANLDGDEEPDFWVSESIYQPLLGRGCFVEFTVGGDGDAVFGEALLLVGEQGLFAGAGEVWEEEEGEEADDQGACSFNYVEPSVGDC